MSTRQEDYVESEGMPVCEIVRVCMQFKPASLCLVLPRQKKEMSTCLPLVYQLVFLKRSSTTPMFVAGL